MLIQDLYAVYQQYPSIQTDTRKIKKGDLFFALKGPNFNGNQFALQALAAGAAYAVVDETVGEENDRIIMTNDALATLQDLAKYHRQQFNDMPEGRQVPFIAITGSNGKTTTKELIHEVLATTYTTYTTKGNLNNHIGVPLSILSIKTDAAIAVIEMGANHQKEIESYCSYTLPSHALITNCGKAHLEGFGGVEGVKKGKGELYDFIRENGGTIFLMNDYDYLKEMSKGIHNIVTYGTADAAIVGVADERNEMLRVIFSKGVSIQAIQTNLVGNYNLPNVLVAVAVGKYFNVPDEKIKVALENYIPSNSRSQLIEKDGNKIILDAYNANPSSMKVAIENIAKISGDKVLLLGGMMEMGEASLPEHQAIVDLIAAYQWKNVVLVGGDFEKIQHPFINYTTAAEAGEWLKKQQLHQATILIKGSRSMQMEKVLE